MEIIINDESLVGQYNETEIIDYCANELIPILDDIEKIDGSILKAYDTYQKYITPVSRVNDLIYKYQRMDPIVDRLKMYLIQLTKDPFWNDNINTDCEKVYTTPIISVPNCITEAYERKGLLFSFDNAVFARPTVKIKCDGHDCLVRNFYTHKELVAHLTDLNLINTWGKNSFVVPGLGYLFEVRFREDNHKQAHFHMSKAGYSISLSIPDCDVLAGSSPDKSKIVSWAFANMKNIVNLWNTIHPELKVE